MTDRQVDVAGPDGAVDGATIAAAGSTYAAFSPDQTTSTHRRAQSSVLIHQKSPLLLATPPQVTRALAYSHGFLLPINYFIGLLSWTTDDSWESFLLLAGFWFTVLYGDIINRFAGPIVLVAGLIFGMYARKYSPLSRVARVDQKKKGDTMDKHTKQEEHDSRKSLDEILDTLQTFTNRCSVLIEPLLSLTEFLSTQTTATASTTRPALMSLFLRILLISPVWTILSLPPLYIITTQRVVLVVGTFVLSFHSTPARVTRALLWRSRLVRALASMTTGLNFSSPAQLSSPRSISARSMAKTKEKVHEKVQFTFTIYENQRRWLGLGWTTSLMSYERPAWTDSQLNPIAQPDTFVLPETDQEGTEWRWVQDSDWHIKSMSQDSDSKAYRDDDDEGWIYYDNSWLNGRATDGWGRYTRKRKWARDAELIDLEQEAAAEAGESADNASISAPAAVGKRNWFGRRRASERLKIADKSDVASTSGIDASRLREDTDEDVLTPLRYRTKEWERDVGEGVVEGLG